MPAGLGVPTAAAVAQNPRILKALSPTAFRAFRDIAGHWKLSRLEQRILLGAVPESTFSKYVRDPESAVLSFDTLQRISHVLGIFKALNVLLPDEQLADDWISKPNSAPLFKGASAKEIMLDGTIQSLAAVRAYLDAERGW